MICVLWANATRDLIDEWLDAESNANMQLDEVLHRACGSIPLSHTRRVLRRDWNFLIASLDVGIANLFALNRIQWTNPDVSKANGIAVILQADWPRRFMFLVTRRAIERGVAEQFKVVEDEDAIVHRRNIGGTL